jgi:hypothetical protein
VDLSAQPADVKIKIAQTIAEGSVPKDIPQIGIKFMKFCGKHDLVKIGEQAQNYAEFLSAAYPEAVVA